MAEAAPPAADATVQPTAPEGTQQAPQQQAPATQEQQQQQAPAAQEPARPAWLPAKFRDAQQLAEAYSALEKRLGQGAKPAQQQQQAPAPGPEGDTSAATPENELAVRQAGFDASAIEDEFLEHGALSAETLAKAEKAGLNKDFIEKFAAGRAALANQQAAELYAVVGGEATFKVMASWARANLTPADLRAFNDATQNKSMALAKLAIQGLHARYVAAQGREPKLINGAAAQGGDGFRSQAEAQAAMRDPRYAKDPAYRADVARKVAAGGIFNARIIY